MISITRSRRLLCVLKPHKCNEISFESVDERPRDWEWGQREKIGQFQKISFSIDKESKSWEKENNHFAWNRRIRLRLLTRSWINNDYFLLLKLFSLLKAFSVSSFILEGSLSFYFYVIHYFDGLCFNLYFYSLTKRLYERVCPLVGRSVTRKFGWREIRCYS